MSNLKKPMLYTQMVDFLLSREKEAKALYKTMTARQLAEHYSVMYNTNWQKVCFRYLGEKELGLGGARQGSGNRAVKDHHIITKKRKPKEVFILGFSEEVAEILKRLGTGIGYSKYIEKLILQDKEKKASQD